MRPFRFVSAVSFVAMLFAGAACTALLDVDKQFTDEPSSSSSGSAGEGGGGVGGGATGGGGMGGSATGGGGMGGGVVLPPPDDTTVINAVHLNEMAGTAALLRRMALDKNGNVWLTGAVDARIEVDGGATKINGDQVAGANAFVAVFNEVGTIVNSRTFAATTLNPGTSIGRAIGIHPTDGTVFLGGDFAQKFTPDAGVTTWDTGMSVGTDTFVLTLDPQTLATKTLVRVFGANADEMQSMAVDVDGNAYFVGRTKSAMLTAGGVNAMVPGSQWESFVLRTLSKGIAEWVRVLSGNIDERIGAVAVEPVTNGRIAIAGHCSAVATYNGMSTIGQTPPVPDLNTRIFAAVLAPNGETVAHSVVGKPGDTNTSFATAVGFTGAGAIHVGGRFKSSFDMGGKTTKTMDLESGGFFGRMPVNSNFSFDAFLTLDSVGSSEDYITAMEYAEGDVIIGGQLAAPGVVFPGTGMLNVSGTSTPFVARLSPNLAATRWVHLFVPPPDQTGSGIVQALAFDATRKQVVVLLLASGSMDFGGSIGTRVATNQDGFLVRLTF